ncbi:HpcH/HpaI aldolase/citrate lyase family protein [Microvirga puerhi]|uniref:CoA ester lyase n=1 Tax=Microvirga puerhi TaxID=2876078 RepID=A0ABS7VKU2_9HYPH|nr:CoA ester lyase [Microvirga puerhi]MBZ6075627.1 CoA ester lyase [Microvirga puerhi]
MTEIRPRRSALYMPGSNLRAIEKARTLPADVLILDLEDSVAPDAKAEARAQVCAAVEQGGFGPREVVIRINALDSPWGEDDLAAAARTAPDAILVPKVSSPETLAAVGLRLRRLKTAETVRIWAMIETAHAILRADAIASATHDVDTRLSCFVLGLNDLARETQTRLVPGRAPMLPWMMIALAAARANGIAILDGVYNNLSDQEGLRAECEQARDAGFDGKTLIHPNQIALANTIFSPTPAELEEAQAVASAFEKPENVGRGAIALNGRMVERLHADMAQRVLGLAQAIEKRCV